MGKISGSSKWDPMLSAVCWNDKFITGAVSGAVYLWSGNSGVPTMYHKHKVDCFAVDQAGNLYSGDAEGKILSWKILNGKLSCEK